jgi:hypothetical protein
MTWQRKRLIRIQMKRRWRSNVYNFEVSNKAPEQHYEVNGREHYERNLPQYLLLMQEPPKMSNCCKNIPWSENKSSYVFFSIIESHLLKVWKLAGIQLLCCHWVENKVNEGRSTKSRLNALICPYIVWISYE